MYIASCFSEFFRKICVLSSLAPVSAAPAAFFALRRWIAALEGLVDDHDVAAELLHALPRDVVILSPAEQAKEPTRPEHDDGLDLPLGVFDLQIPHIAQAAAVTDVDDLLAPQTRKSLQHSIPPRRYPMPRTARPILSKRRGFRRAV